MDRFEYKDFTGDWLTVRASSVGPLVFEIRPTDQDVKNVLIDQKDAASIADLRDALDQWLEENKPKLPTNVGAVITANIEGTPSDWPHRERTLTRMSGTGHVWHDVDTGTLYTHDEIESFDIKFEGIPTTATEESK